jgi:hypothetical protein
MAIDVATFSEPRFGCIGEGLDWHEQPSGGHPLFESQSLKEQETDRRSI